MAVEEGLADVLSDGLGVITSLAALAVRVERVQQGDHRWPGLITLAFVAWIVALIARGVLRRRRDPTTGDAPIWSRERAGLAGLAVPFGFALCPLLVPFFFGLHASSDCIVAMAFVAYFVASLTLRIRWRRAGYKLAGSGHG